MASESSAAYTQTSEGDPHIIVRNLTMAYGSFVLMRDLNFVVRRGDIFIIMGGSGCGKSTLLRYLIGLKEAAIGEIFYEPVNFTKADPEERQRLLRRFGVLYQGGGLWSSMTLAENVGLPLGEFTDLTPAQIREVAAFKLSMVGLKGFEDYYPNEISGGMQKRAGLARAMALDPKVLFFDERSAGLDPISSRLLDNLILELRESLGATIVVVTHELASIFTIASNSDSPLAVRLDQALDRLSDTAQSVQELSDYLQQNPSSLIRGRYVPVKERQSMGIRSKLILITVSTALFGCSPLAPRPDQTKFFILTPLSDAAASPL